VSDRPDVYVRLAAIKFFLRHDFISVLLKFVFRNSCCARAE
jgi:hypothetical protein